MVPPVHVTTTFIRDPDNQYRAGFIYGRPDNATVRQAEAVIAALEGAADAKLAWTESGMIEDISAGLDAVSVPVTVVIGDRDQIEHEAALRGIFGRFLPHATFRVLKGIGHLSPLEAPDAIAGTVTERSTAT